mgnify:FL=1
MPVATLSGAAKIRLRNAMVAGLRAYLGLALRTQRWSFDIHPEARKLLLGLDGQTAIIAFWHELLPLAPALWWWALPQNPALHLNVLISRNRDGRFIADIVGGWGIRSIAGSSDRKGKNKGGMAAYREMLRLLRGGQLVSITPDGPQGPRHTVKGGVLRLARQSGEQIVPMGMICAGFRLKTWDRMVFPLPFGRGIYIADAPLDVSDMVEDEASETLRKTLIDVADQAVRRRRRTFADMSWGVLTELAAPVLTFTNRRRVRRGKEIEERVRERMGFSSVTRPHGRVIWIHAASVGETLSVVPLIEECLKQSDASVLITTGTVTSSEIVARRFNTSRVIHQFVPLDVGRWVGRFLDVWLPECLVLTESEIWPGLVLSCQERGIPVAVVNGRLSERAAKGWSRLPGVARTVFGRLAWITARSMEDEERFRAMGATDVFCAGDLKMSSPALEINEELRQRIEHSVGSRPVLLAASTHEGEESLLAEAADILRHEFPDFLLVIVPRHPHRGAGIARQIGNAPRLSENQYPQMSDPVWVADTLGDLGTLFSVFHLVFVGNSLMLEGSGGGHNPFEPAKSGCAVVTGPRMQNFVAACTLLAPELGLVANATDLAGWVSEMLRNPEAAASCGERLRKKSSAFQDLPADLARRILTMAGR